MPDFKGNYIDLEHAVIDDPMKVNIVTWAQRIFLDKFKLHKYNVFDKFYNKRGNRNSEQIISRCCCRKFFKTFFFAQLKIWCFRYVCYICEKKQTTFSPEKSSHGKALFTQQGPEVQFPPKVIISSRLWYFPLQVVIFFLFSLWFFPSRL